MKTYIFLTHAFHGYTGGPSYVRNKKIWLENHGWKVIGFDLFPKREGENDINFKELKEFRDNRLEELQIHPSWFSCRTRETVLNRILNQIDLNSEQIVIESNTQTEAEWGELLANKINAKHLIYLIGENVYLKTKEEFDFFYFKKERGELFSISRQAFQLFFKPFITVNDEDTMYWNAMSSIEPQEISVPELDKIQQADYNICHFGREKNYLSYVIPQLETFVNLFPARRFNIIFFGTEQLCKYNTDKLSSFNNVHLYFIKSYFPIPKKIFKISDVVIATAGCARIAFGEEATTVSMNVETNVPLGILGYTTNNISYSSDQYPDSKLELSEILSDILIEQKYKNEEPSIKLEERKNGYNYQMSFINNSREFYPSVLKIKGVLDLKRSIVRIFARLNLLRMFNSFKYMFS